jgi:hypothetical protein
MNYKVVVTNVVPEVDDEGKQKHLLVSQKGGKRNLAIPCYKKQVETIKSGISFSEAKEIRNSNKNSKIVKE